jgi:hypothetical protein
MTQFIGQITVILEADDAGAAEQRLRKLATHLDEISPDIEFADHNGDVEDYAEVQAECEASLNSPPSPVTPFDGYEVHGVRRYGRGKSSYCEQVPDAEAQFWSVYGHIPGQGVDCIGDFKTRQHAEEVVARISRMRFVDRRMAGADSALRQALSECLRILADYDEAEGEEGNAYRQGLAALGLSDQPITPAGE